MMMTIWWQNTDLPATCSIRGA